MARGRPRVWSDEVRAFVVEQRQARATFVAIADQVCARFADCETFNASSASRICRDAGVKLNVERRRPADLAPRKISLGGPVWSRPERYQV